MTMAIGAALVAFFAALLGGCGFIPLLRRLKYGQQVHELVPEGHQKKQGTPTMGGLLFAAAGLIAILIFHRGSWSPKADMVLVAFLFCLLNMCIGMADDLLKIMNKKNNKGLSPKQKLIPQTILALAFACYLYFHPEVGSAIRIPFTGFELRLGILYIPFATFVIVATTNSANLLDGLDGLLGSVALLNLLTFGIIALLFGTSDGNLSIFAFAVAGACLGYLRYNIHPAMLMMGDTGSMFLGGAIASLALMTRTPLLIVIAGFMMLVSSLSTMIQRAYYRRTGGKRIFLSSPLHHHFELKGMGETRIVGMYTIVTAVLCLFALLTIGGNSFV